jgi:filamentous hemagglutinin family protein
MRIKISILIWVPLYFLCVVGLRSAPTTITANGLGTSVTNSANYYKITGGTAAGGNLFQSFSTFNVGTGATADFNVSSGVTNILARVTGGASTIDGTITSTVGNSNTVSNANLFLINPAGLMFTANAQINLNGSFVVSTANYVKLGSGGAAAYFYADLNHPINDAGLTSAPVSAFGFLGTTPPQAITFTGSQFTTQSGQGIHVIGGDISLTGAALNAPGGYVTLFSAASAGEVPFDLTMPGSGYSASTFAQYGAINFSSGASASISGAGGGAVVIRGGKLVLSGGSSITSENFGPLVGGNISLQAVDLSLSGASTILTESFGGANAGSVTADVAEKLSVSDSGSEIASVTYTSGDSGMVTVNAQGAAIDLDNGEIVSATDSAGAAGTVSVTASSLTMTGSSFISTATHGIGNAGTVELSLAGELDMTDSSQIIADTLTQGNGGNVDVSAASIIMADQALISANTVFSTGAGGNISVTANSLSIHGPASQPLGELGIEAVSETSGNAGTIIVNAANLSLNGPAAISCSSIGNGLAGDVTVQCSNGQLANGSEITASAVFNNAGAIAITANNFSILSGSTITTSAGFNGGNITFKVNQLLYLDDSNIQAFAGVPTHGFGLLQGKVGGNIDIDPEFLVLDNSFISANDLSPGGRDGNITNVSDFYFNSNSYLFATGTIQSPSPDLQLGNQLLDLPANLADARAQLKETCAQSTGHEFSSLIVVGRGGTETTPDELQSDFGLDAEVR